MNIDTSKKVIRSLMEQIRYSVYARNPEFSALRIFFLIYAVDNCIGAADKEVMQQCVRVQKLLAARNVEHGVDTLIPLLQSMDGFCGLDHILSQPDNISAYARELFGDEQNRQKRNASRENFRAIMALLGGVYMEESGDGASAALMRMRCWTSWRVKRSAAPFQPGL